MISIQSLLPALVLLITSVDLLAEPLTEEWYDEAVEFCHKYDQNCFDPNYDSESLSFFEPMLRRLMEQPPFLVMSSQLM